MKEDSSPCAQPGSSSPAKWKAIVAKYQNPTVPRSVWQVANTLIPYIALWIVMGLTIHISYWLTLPLAILTAGFVVRLFIIFHDCGHGSFFKSTRANDILGAITGVLTFTPYFHWRWEHALHHASSGNLDRRGTGDVWTLTVQEYLESSRWKRFAYRLARNPFILFVLAPLYLFVIHQRLTNKEAPRRERLSVYWTNLALAAMVTGFCLLLGWKAYLAIQLTILVVSGAAGVWLFYVQHQFEGVYWQRRGEWDYATAALQGSSFYKLPKVLQWFSGSIGFHHIHHLSPRIPNYLLEKCQKEEPLFQAVKPITLFSSLKSFSFRLWDEQSGRLVGYAFLATVAQAKRQSAKTGSGRR